MTSHPDIWLIPTVSFGNVPQLVVDLIFENTVMHPSRASLAAPFLLPFAGSLDGTGCIGTSLESRQSANDRLLVFQQRAPPARGRNRAHAEHLLSLPQRPKCVVLLHALHAAFRLDAALYASEETAAHPHFGYAANAAYRAGGAAACPLELGGLREFESSKVFQQGSFPAALCELTEKSGIPLVALVFFSNGNGIPESFSMFSVLYSLLGHQILSLVSTSSSSSSSSSSSLSTTSTTTSSSTTSPTPLPPSKSIKLSLPLSWKPYQ